MDSPNKHARILLGIGLLALAWVTPAAAGTAVATDDTEIFSMPSESVPDGADIVFILDTSGSMSWRNCVGNCANPNVNEHTRASTGDIKITQLRKAFEKILFEVTDGVVDHNTVNANLVGNRIAIMRFNEGNDSVNLNDRNQPTANGGYFIWPLTKISSAADAQNVWCIINGCIVSTETTNEDGTTTTTTTTIDSLIDSDGSTPLAETLFEAAKFFRGEVPAWYTYDTTTPVKAADILVSGKYDTPLDDDIATNKCNSNSHIVLLTDGQANYDEQSDPDIATMIGKSCTGNCLDEIADYLRNDGGLITVPNQEIMRNVAVHTIAFDLEVTSAVNLLQATAAAGKGKYKTASSADTLAAAFADIINGLNTSTTSFVAPALSISQANSSAHDSEIYYALFEPANTTKWQGNIKAYRMLDGAIMDFSTPPGNVFNDNGLFFATARDKWGEEGTQNGDVITAGGAESKLPAPGSRNILTNTNTVTPNTLVAFNSTNVSAELLEVAKTAADWGITSTYTDLGVATEDEAVVINNAAATVKNNEIRDDIIKWARGGDPKRENALGDPLHSQPAVVNYGGDSGKYVFFGTNEGFLHAIKTSDGSETFAFIPNEFLPNLNTFMDNATLNPGATPPVKHPYGIDGNIVAWVNDANGDGRISDPENTGDHVYLYFGLRRGGSLYYALDVTDPAQPSVLWKIGGDTLTDLGQTWSTPIKTKIKTGSTDPGSVVVKDVLVFGGGYDSAQDIAIPTEVDDKGKAIYIVNAETGALDWKAIGGATASASSSELVMPEMNFSIPSDIAVIDLDMDEVADRLYFGDMGGQVFRIDLDSTHNNGGTVTYRPYGILMASLGGSGADQRRFYYAPDIALVKTGIRQYISVNIGSGYRASPKSTAFADRFYALRDDSPFTPLTDTTVAGFVAPKVIKETATAATEVSLVDVTDLYDPDDSAFQTIIDGSHQGWYIRLTTSGEKVLAPATTAANVLLFTTYTPANNDGTTCSAKFGDGYLYMVNLFDGTAARTRDVDGVSTPYRDDDLIAAGIPPSPLVFLEANGTSNPLLSTIVGTQTFGGVLCDGTNDDPLCIQVSKTFWQQITQ